MTNEEVQRAQGPADGRIAPKGPNNTAQGNALGSWHPLTLHALKGQNKYGQMFQSQTYRSSYSISCRLRKARSSSWKDWRLSSNKRGGRGPWQGIGAWAGNVGRCYFALTGRARSCG